MTMRSRYKIYWQGKMVGYGDGDTAEDAKRDWWLYSLAAAELEIEVSDLTAVWTDTPPAG